MPNHQPVLLLMCLLLQNHTNNDKTTNHDNINCQTQTHNIIATALLLLLVAAVF